MSKPYRLRTRIRRHLPWFLINVGVCAKGNDCEKAGGIHDWYNMDGVLSACYHCKVVREGRLWQSSGSSGKMDIAGSKSQPKKQAEQDADDQAAAAVE